MSKPSLIIFLISLSCGLLLPLSAAISEAECKVCNDTTSKFHEGLLKTDKQNFGGGNTAWEERKLGTYLRSETRLITILEEHVCGKTKDDFKCQQFVERHETEIERWWFDVFANDMENAFLVDGDKSLRSTLCVKDLKVCCGANRYGEQCELSCTDTTCNGHGKCTVDGTRSLKARKCTCNDLTSGSNCEFCKSGWFKKQLATDNENTAKFECERCDRRCHSCVDQASNCERCASGFEKLQQGVCVDVDECARNASLCSAIGRDGSSVCVNTDGSYRCECADGFVFERASSARGSGKDWDLEDAAYDDELPEETEARLAEARRNGNANKCVSISEIVSKRTREQAEAILDSVPVDTLQRTLETGASRLQQLLVYCLVVFAVWLTFVTILYFRLGSRSTRPVMFLCAVFFAFTYWQFTQIGSQADVLQQINTIIRARQGETAPTDEDFNNDAASISGQHDEM